MTAISPSQLDIVAAFLETSRDHLELEHPIRLYWPRPVLISRCGERRASSRAARPAGKPLPRTGKPGNQQRGA